MMKDIRHNTKSGSQPEPTILYFHGGGAVLMDPTTHRPTVVKLCKYANARALSIRYRLAPQNPFPAALLDALQAYLYLLYPPPSAFHAAVPASSIILAGDSSGGTLCFSLTHLLLYFHHHNINSSFNGIPRSIPLPAGFTTPSPWLDITRSLPSWRTNAPYDYLPSPASHPDGMYYPPSSIWPAVPKRKNFIAEESMLDHPLVSPIMVQDWTGAPPMWIRVGGRGMMRDEVRWTVDKVVGNEGKVKFEEWEGMVHCFLCWLLGGGKSEVCLRGWGDFVRDVVDGMGMETEGCLVKAREKGRKREKWVVGDLSEIIEEEVRALVGKRVRDVREEERTDGGLLG